MSKRLKDLEREQDEATLEFWEAMTALDEANDRYRFAQAVMTRTKAAYLKEKLGKK